MIDTVIFDMDGVIIDSEPIFFKIEQQMFHELNIEVPFEEHSTYVGTSSQNMWTLITTRHSVLVSADDLVKREFGLYMNYLQNVDGLRAIDGAVELIQELTREKFKIAIASSSHMDVIDTVIDRFELTSYFMVKMSGSLLTHPKPEPDIFLETARLLDVPPDHCVVIEDSQNGVLAARAAGMRCIGFVNPHSGLQDLSAADIVVSGFHELNSHLIRNMQ